MNNINTRVRLLLLFLSLYLVSPVQALPSFVLDFVNNFKFPEINVPKLPNVPRFPEVFTDLTNKCANGLSQLREHIFDVNTPALPIAPIVQAEPNASAVKPLIFGAAALFALGWTIKKVFYEEETADA